MKALFFRVATVATMATAALFTTQIASADSAHYPLVHISPTFDVTAYGVPQTLDIQNFTLTNTYSKASGTTETVGDFSLTYIHHVPGTNANDAVTAVTFVNDTLAYNLANPLANNCYSGEVLGPKQVCNVDLTITFTGKDPIPGGLNGLATYEGGNNIAINVTGTDSLSNPLSSPGYVNVQVTDTPEPGSLVLLGSGMLGLAGLLRRKLGRG